MKVLCFSSFTFSYLNRARVLFKSIRKYHPRWHLVALITDVPPPQFSFDPEDEPFDSVVYARQLGIRAFDSWLFKHDVVEACTAVKGPFIDEACRDNDVVIYLDPDTCLFESLAPIEKILETYEIVLTPHLCSPEGDMLAVQDNEMSALKTGTYNLGFCAIRTTGEGARFAKWWAERLLSFCYSDIPNGLFVDQRWCDLVPAIFGKVKILRDPGYNVASWNLSNRKISIEKNGSVLVNGSPLRFWHFTKLGRVGDAMTRRYAKDNFPVYEIWNWYRKQVDEMTDPSIPQNYWAYATYANGERIERQHRLIYRSMSGSDDLFSNPFECGPGSFFDWLSHGDPERQEPNDAA